MNNSDLLYLYDEMSNTSDCPDVMIMTLIDYMRLNTPGLTVRHFKKWMAKQQTVNRVKRARKLRNRDRKRV